MNRLTCLYTSVLVSALVLLGGCRGSEQIRAERESVVDTETLVSFLKKNGFTIFDEGPFTSSGMKAPGEKFTVLDGGEIYVFEFENSQDAIGATNWVRQTWPERLRELKLYRKDTLVVVTLGGQHRLATYLVRVMETQIL